jgi:SpoVK/Ycf46/Vps4 family AAA+-type ATPase
MLNLTINKSMAELQDIFKEINSLKIDNKETEALEKYKSFLEDKNQSYKFETVSKLINDIDGSWFEYCFTYGFADLLLIDPNDQIVYLIWVNNDFKPHSNNYGYFKWRESVRDTLEEDFERDYSYEVQVICLFTINEIDEDIKKVIQSRIKNSNQDHIKTIMRFEYENENFSYYLNNEFDVEEVFPYREIDMFVEDNYKDVYKDCLEYAIGLADLNSDENDRDPEELKPVLHDPKYEFDILQAAPEEFNICLKENQKAFEGFNPDQLFSLSMHAVFTGNPVLKIDELTELYRDSIFRNSTGSLPEISKLDASKMTSKDAWASELNILGSKVALIYNIEKITAKNLVISRADIIDELISALERDSSVLFILSVPKNTWDEFIAEYPILRIYFQRVFHFEKLKLKHLRNHFITEIKSQGLEIERKALKLVDEYFYYIQQGSDKLLNYAVSGMLAKEVHYYQIIRKGQNNETLAQITREDVYRAIKDEYQPKEKFDLENTMAELNSLVGLKNIKQQIFELSSLLKVNKLRKELYNIDEDPVSLHMLFTGNPGTGKTTVAMLLGQIYQSVGALSNGHVVFCSRKDIVSQWIGHTEERMTSLIERARGGILFIDEAYSLYVKDMERDFGREAINVLVDMLEQIRENTVVILAGYPKPMEKFLEANPGLASRFPNTISFPNYDVEELFEIYLRLIKKNQFVIEDKAVEIVKKTISNLWEQRDENFGNARTCRNLFERTKIIQAQRISTIKGEINNADLNLIKVEDVIKLSKEHEPKKPVKSPLGFKY